MNETEDYKKSPTIQKLFNYDLFKLDSGKMFLIFKDFKCDNIFNIHRGYHQKYNITSLFFYLLECNTFKKNKEENDDEDGQVGGAEKKDYDDGGELMDPPSNDDPIPESEGDKKLEKPEGEMYKGMGLEK